MTRNTAKRRAVFLLERLRGELQRAFYEIALYRELHQAVVAGDPAATTRALAALSSRLRPRRNYSDDYKREVIRHVAEIGAALTARRHGIPFKTVLSWCYKAGVSSAGLVRRRKRRRRRWAEDNPGYANLYDWHKAA